MVTPTTTPQGPAPAGSPAAYTFEPDAEMAAIIAKREAGAKLTPSEGGKLGQWLKKAGKTVGAAAAGIKNAIAPATDSVPTPPVSPTPPPDSGLPSVPPDADLVRGVVRSLLESANDLSARKLSAAARARGADGETLRRMQGAKVFGEARTAMITGTAPQAFAAMGITDGNAFALSVFWGNIALGGCDLWLAIDELNNMAKPAPQPKPTTPPPPATNAPTPAPQSPAAVEPQWSGQPTNSRIPQAPPPPPMMEKKSDAS